MNTEAISLASNIAILASATIVSVVAILGLRAWRREMTGKAKFEVARNIMLLGRKFAVDFHNARSPFTSVGEFQDRPQQPQEVAAESIVLNEWYARNRRLQPLNEDLQKLQEALWEAEIMLNETAGERVKQVFDVFRKSYAELESSIPTYFEIRQQEASSGSQYHDPAFPKELREVIYARGTDNLTKEVDKATAMLGSELSSYVK